MQFSDEVMWSPGDFIFAALLLGVLAVGILGALISRFQARGLSNTLFAVAFSQVLMVVIALFKGFIYPSSGVLELVLLNTIFIVLWLGSAILLRKVHDQTLAT